MHTNFVDIEKRFRRVKSLFYETLERVRTSRISLAFSITKNGVDEHYNCTCSSLLPGNVREHVNDPVHFSPITANELVGIVLKDSALGLKMYGLELSLRKVNLARWNEFMRIKGHVDSVLTPAIRERHSDPKSPLEFRMIALNDSLKAIYVSVPRMRNGNDYYWSFQRFHIPSLDPQGLDIQEWEPIDEHAGDSPENSPARVQHSQSILEKLR